jgi:hypothetical protein
VKVTCEQFTLITALLSASLAPVRSLFFFAPAFCACKLSSSKSLHSQLLFHTSQPSIKRSFTMTDRAPSMTVTFDIPMLAGLLQSNHDLRREMSELRTELSNRLHAIETQLATQNTNVAAPLRDLVHDASPTHGSDLEHEDLNTQTNGDAQQDGHVRDDYEDNLVQERDLAHDSSPSVDEGITLIDSPSPASGRKRKRVTKSAVHQSPYINHSGFVVRGSDTQLAQNKAEAGPSRSESSFDSSEDGQQSSGRLEMMPPVRPLSKPPRAQRPKTIITDEPVLPEPEEITTRYDYCLLECAQR